MTPSTGSQLYIPHLIPANIQCCKRLCLSWHQGVPPPPCITRSIATITEQTPFSLMTSTTSEIKLIVPMSLLFHWKVQLMVDLLLVEVVDSMVEVVATSGCSPCCLFSFSPCVRGKEILLVLINTRQMLSQACDTALHAIIEDNLTLIC